MKKWLIVILIMCFAIPISMLWYKTQKLSLSLIPQKMDDVWNIHLTIDPKGDVFSVTFPVPKTNEFLKVSDERIKVKGTQALVEESSDSKLVTWVSKKPISGKVSYSARIDINAIPTFKMTKDEAITYPKLFKKYLKKPDLTPEEEEIIKTLEGAILEGKETKSQLARKIFYYVNEEIQRNVKFKTIQDALNTGKGSPLIKAKIYTYLMRRHNIPSRIVALVRLPLPEDPPVAKHKLTFANEVFLNNKWIPVDTNRGHFAERPDRYLVFYHHYEEIESSLSRKKLTYTISAERSVINKFNKESYRQELIKKDSTILALSFYKLPLPMQNIFALMVIIPLGALVLCIARNLIGIPTFGMFTPILLTMFFKETNLTFGIIFFLATVLIGIFERYVLDKLYLLAIPRLSILLTLVIILLMLFSFTGLDQYFSIQSHISFFPIVIVTTFIEKFSIMITEEGWVTTFKALLGTLMISVMSYSLYSINSLEVLMFSNPEILLMVIGCLILIGRYTGYRVSEFFRFKDLVKQVKVKKNAL
jgi:hypothetical protein